MASFGTTAGSSTGQSASQTQVLPEMKDIYGQLLDLNKQNYSKVLENYGGFQNALTSQLADVYKGYGDVENKVLGTLGMGAKLGGDNWGVAQPGANAIERAFAQTKGATDQQLVNAGLGNTTARGNLQNQNTLQKGEAYTGLASQLAQTAAGYQAQLGSAGLQSRLQGLGMQTGLTQSYMGDLAGYRFANTAGSLTGQTSNSSSQSQGAVPTAGSSAGPLPSSGTGAPSILGPMVQGGGGGSLANPSTAYPPGPGGAQWGMSPYLQNQAGGGSFGPSPQGGGMSFGGYGGAGGAVAATGMGNLAPNMGPGTSNPNAMIGGGAQMAGGSFGGGGNEFDPSLIGSYVYGDTPGSDEFDLSNLGDWANGQGEIAWGDWGLPWGDIMDSDYSSAWY